MSDGVCRIIGIADRNKDEKESRVIERPVREVVRLFNIDDTSLLDQIGEVENLAKKLLGHEQTGRCAVDSDLNADQIIFLSKSVGSVREECIQEKRDHDFKDVAGDFMDEITN